MMKIKATCIVDNTAFVGEADATHLHADDLPGAISGAIEDVMNAAREAGHDDLSGFTVTVTFTPPAVENEPDEPAEA